MRAWQPIDLYCERVQIGLFGEPLNLVTNICFIIAAVLLLRRQFLNKSPWTHKLLSLTALIVGLGSALFHSFAVYWAQLADVIPIGFFLCYFIFLFFWQVEQKSLAVSLGVVLGFLGSIALCFSFLQFQFLGNSQNYIPVLFVLVYLALTRTDTRIRNFFLAAASMFLAALTFRAVDIRVCSIIPFGSHFLWHVFNSGVIYVAIRGLEEQYWQNFRSKTSPFN